MEDGTSFSGNSNNVFTTGGGGGGNGISASQGNNVGGGGAGMGVVPGGEHLMMSSSQSSAAIANNSESNCHVNRTDASTNTRLMFTIGNYEDSRHRFSVQFNLSVRTFCGQSLQFLCLFFHTFTFDRN